MAKKKTTTKARKQGAISKRTPSKSTNQRKSSGLDLAAMVLAKSNEPLTCMSIAEKAIAAGWQTKGKTPHATLYSAMIREIDKKGKDARFKKVGRGQFIANAKVKA